MKEDVIEQVALELWNNTEKATKLVNKWWGKITKVYGEQEFEDFGIDYFAELVIDLEDGIKSL